MNIQKLANDTSLMVYGMSEVHCVYLVGSTTVALSDIHSDIDLLAICDRRPSAASRLRHYRSAYSDQIVFESFNLNSWEFGHSDSFVFAGVSVCIMFYSIAELNAKLDGIVGGDVERRGFYQPTGFLSALANAKLLNGGAESIERMFSDLKLFPKSLRDEIIRRNSILLKYFAEKIEVALDRNDSFCAQQCFFHLREAGLAMFFAAARQYRVSDKRIPAAIAACEFLVPVSLVALVKMLVDMDNYSIQSMKLALELLRPCISEIRELPWRRMIIS